MKQRQHTRAQVKRSFLRHVRPELDAGVPRQEGRLNHEGFFDALLARL